MKNTRKMTANTRVKTPTVLQMEAVECGAASLAMVLGYHGLIVPLETLRIECGVSRDGSKASNIVKAARKFGMEAKGFRKEPEELCDLTLPMIVFWNFNHFVVLEGFKKNLVFINDPAAGPKVLSYEEFDKCFTGVALTFNPGTDFKKGGSKPSIIKSLRRRLKGATQALTYAVLAGLFLVVPGLVIPVFSKIFVDDILVAKMHSWLQPLLLAMAFAALLRGGLTWLQQHYLLRLETKMAMSSSAAFFRRIFLLPVEFFDQRYAGEISNRIQINDKVARLLSGTLATNVLNLMMVVFYALLMLQYDVKLTLVGVGIAMINLLVLRYVAGKQELLNQKLQQETGKLMGISMSGLQMMETLKATGAESDFFSQWAGQQSKVVNVQQELSIPNQIITIMPPFLLAVNTVAILAVGGFRVMDGFLTMGMLVAFQSLMSSFMNPFNEVVSLGSTLQTAKADMNRLDDVLNYQCEKRFAPATVGDKQVDNENSVVQLSGQMELVNLTFGYNKLEPPLIENFNLNLQPGSRVALVGGSGSGKSTIAKLASGLYGPWSGEIIFDGQAMHDLSRALFNNSVAIVDQEIFQFEGSIRDNLTMWDETIPDRVIQRAAKDACIHDDIAARPGGYASAINEGGGNFSGGQRQRLEIARALVSNPSILMLDEATSALDPHTEKLVDGNLRRRGCTCLIIAHRLSTIRDCDEILVLERGKVVQRGTHEELSSMDGLYAELIKAQ